MGETNWEHFHHGADIGVRGLGNSPGEAFEQAAIAMTAVITDPDLVVPERKIRLRCEAPDMELLLTDWLNEIVRVMATRRMLFSRFRVAIDNHRLDAEVWGENVDRERHEPAVEIKGATYTELDVTRLADGRWQAQAVVDV